MSEPVRLSRRRARQLAVMGQLLDAPRRASIEDVVARLGQVQIDPTSAVARTEHLVLFSRLGPRFRVAELERLLWNERSLFEYWVHIVPTATFRCIGSRCGATRAATGRPKTGTYGSWLAANASFRPVRAARAPCRGPLRARDLEDRVAEGWQRWLERRRAQRRR